VAALAKIKNVQKQQSDNQPAGMASRHAMALAMAQQIEPCPAELFLGDSGWWF